MVAANAQTSCRLLTTSGKLSSWSNTQVWFVRPKLDWLSETGALALEMCLPINTLWERRTKCVGAGALHDIDERSRVEDYLENPSSVPISRHSSFYRRRALPRIFHIPWRNWPGLGKLGRSCRSSSNLFRRWGMKGDPEGRWYDVAVWVNRRYMAMTGTTRAIQRPKG